MNQEEDAWTEDAWGPIRASKGLELALNTLKTAKLLTWIGIRPPTKPERLQNMTQPMFHLLSLILSSNQASVL